MNKPASFRSVIAWQKAMDLFDAVDDTTETWPPEQQFRMAGQIQRAVLSVPANFARGWGRFGPKKYGHHLSIAHGSLCETEMLIIAARRRRYVDQATEERLLALASEVGRLINGLSRSLRLPRSSVS